MPRLISYEGYEGSGVYEADGKLTYIDWPYTIKQQKPITQQQAERLILRMDFERCDIQFDDLSSLIEFLRAKANEGPDPFKGMSEEELLSMFDSLGPKNFMGILDSIQHKYIDTGLHERAAIGLNRMLNTNTAQDNPFVKERIEEMLKSINT